MSLLPRHLHSRGGGGETDSKQRFFKLAINAIQKFFKDVIGLQEVWFRRIGQGNTLEEVIHKVKPE